MRWKYTNASVTGKAHTDRGETGQDFSRAGIIQIADADFFIGLVADGAGSTTEGGRGAAIACDTLFEKITVTLQENPDVSAITDEIVGAWITAARNAIIAEAESSGNRLREYASTILGTIAGNGQAIFFQIGDGAIVVGAADEYQVIFWPEQGEYANTTYFITDEQFREHLHVTRSEAPDEIALFTDGLQTLVLSFSQKKAHAGFFRPLFGALRNDTGDTPAGFSAQLETFLARDDISARSDDDKTLVLALLVKE